VVDGEVLVAGEVFLRPKKLVGLIHPAVGSVAEYHGHDDARQAEAEPQEEGQQEDLEPEGAC